MCGGFIGDVLGTNKKKAPPIPALVAQNHNFSWAPNTQIGADRINGFGSYLTNARNQAIDGYKNQLQSGYTTALSDLNNTLTNAGMATGEYADMRRKALSDHYNANNDTSAYANAVNGMSFAAPSQYLNGSYTTLGGKTIGENINVTNGAGLTSYLSGKMSGSAPAQTIDYSSLFAGDNQAQQSFAPSSAPLGTKTDRTESGASPVSVTQLFAPVAKAAGGAGSSVTNMGSSKVVG